MIYNRVKLTLRQRFSAEGFHAAWKPLAIYFKCARLLPLPKLDWRELIGQKRQKSQGVAHREGRTRSLQIAVK